MGLQGYSFGDNIYGIGSGISNQWTNIGQIPQQSLIPNLTTENLNTGLKLVSDLANAWGQYQNYRMTRDTLNFNKDMMTKNYEMAKDAYDRRVRRSNMISNQVAQQEGWSSTDIQNMQKSPTDNNNTFLNKNSKIPQIGG